MERNRKMSPMVKKKNMKINLDMAHLLNFAETFKQLLCACSDLKEMLSQ